MEKFADWRIVRRPYSLWRHTRLPMLAAELVFLGVLVWSCTMLETWGVRSDRAEVVQIDTLCMALSCMMLFSGIRSSLKEEENVWMMLAIGFIGFYLFLDAGCWLVDGSARLRVLNILANTLFFESNVLMTLVFWRYLCAMESRGDACTRWATLAILLLSIFSTVMILLNLVTGWYFTVTPEGVYTRSATYPISLIGPMLALALCVVQILCRRINIFDKLILLSYPLLPMSVYFNTRNAQSTMIAASVTFAALFFVYSNLFAKREQELTQREKELTESRLNTMLMQINPHFIYNTLGSIASLCQSDADAAEEMIYRFSDYLRDNFTDMNSHQLVSFDREIEHLRHYLSIEQVRFPEIRVEYRLKATDFVLPGLTVQPLVENAVRHGICRRRDSAGTVTIESWEEKDAWFIRVTDDGVGFDEIPQDGRRHIGLQNVGQRLHLLCDGTLRVQSEPGKGTRCTVSIPRNKGREE